ncbi:MAG: hypothetical protein K6U03_05285, partial [Firmicutes bacterium]|nr:hypothetical protein [Bacillota bacterium]
MDGHPRWWPFSLPAFFKGYSQRSSFPKASKDKIFTGAKTKLQRIKLFKTGDSAYFWNIPMYAFNRKCEVWLVRKQLTRHTFESPTASLAKPIRGVILTTSSTDAKQQEALAETV